MKTRATIKRIKKITVVAGILAYALLSGLMVRAYLKYDEAKLQLGHKIEQHQELKREMDQMQQLLAGYRKEMDDFQQYFLKERDVPTFLEGISQFAKDSSVNITEMKTQKFTQVEIPRDVQTGVSVLSKSKPRSQDDQASQQRFEEIITLAEMPIQIQVKGAFESLMDFMFYLEGYEQLLSLGNVEIDINREYPALSCRFLLKIYSLKSLQELGRL